MNHPPLTIDLQSRIHNKFLIEVVDTQTGRVRQKLQAKNIICNQLWNNWFLKQSWNSYIHYGSGSGTPATSDTSLFNYIGGAQSTSYSVDYNEEECWVSFTKYIQLSETTAAGVTLTEVGIAYGATKTNLCTHAMLEDMNGNPVSLAKTDTDIVNIYATVFVHWTKIPGVKLFGYWKGSNYAAGWGALAGLTSLPVNLAAFTKGITGKTFRSNPQGMATFASTVDGAARTLTLTFTRLAAGSKNVSGLHHLVLYSTVSSFTGSNVYHGVHRPWASIELPSEQIPASVITGESIGTGDGVTQDFVTAFPYATNAKIYIDGVESSNVEVYSDRYSPGWDLQAYLEEVKIKKSGGLSTFKFATDASTSSDYSGARDVVAGDYYVFYNPNYLIGIASMSIYKLRVEASNNLEDWEVVYDAGTSSSTTTVTIPDEYQHYKYWKFVALSTSMNPSNIVAPSGYSSNNIHFSTPPAEGAVITADYTTQCIAKDVNHVFDISVVFHFGEHTEAQ